MACYEPIIAYEVKNAKTDTGKKVIIFKDDPNKETTEIAIPCGKCIGCRMDYSKEWQVRIVKEAEQWKDNVFLTLTYNNENLPTKDVINAKTGEITTGHPLRPEDFRDFIKRLRKEYDRKFEHTGIRYYACGEYGSKGMRPHYHAALFNIDVTAFNDVKKIGVSGAGYPIFTSERIEKIWGKGFITIGELTAESAAYIARYMLKKQKGPEKEWYYESQGLVPEMTRSSTHNGIAHDYIIENAEKLAGSDALYVPRRNKKPLKHKVPEYGMRILEKEAPEMYERIREMREEQKVPLEERVLRHKGNSKGYFGALKDRETNEEKKLKSLVRPLSD